MAGTQTTMKKVGIPLTELTSLFYRERRVYRQKLRVQLNEALKPNVPMKHPIMGVCWAYIVYENMKNVCMFCATVGHEHLLCPVKFRLKQTKEQGLYKEQLGLKTIPETQVGRWVTDRTLVPRECVPMMRSETREGSQNVEEPRREKKQKRVLDLNERGIILLRIEEQSEQGKDGAENVQGGSLNSKRAREANPNSLPHSQ